MRRRQGSAGDDLRSLRTADVSPDGTLAPTELECRRRRDGTWRLKRLPDRSRKPGSPPEVAQPFWAAEAKLGPATGEMARPWEQIEAGRYMPRRTRGSFPGRELG